MPYSTYTRDTGLCCVAGGLLAIGGNAVTANADPAVAKGVLSYPLSTGMFFAAQVFFALTQALMLLGLLGLARSRAAGPGRLASTGTTLAVTGMALTIPGELTLGFFGGSKTESATVNTISSLFGLATILASLGLILAGIRIIRHAAWAGWQRWTPLTAGAYYPLVLMPTFALAGFGNLWAIAGWDICFITIGLALLQPAPTPQQTTAPA